MVEGFTGLAGSGKTYYLSKIGLDAIKKGRPVYANFTLKGANKFRQLQETFNVRSGVILVDEINLVCPSRWWSKFPPELAYYWSQTRKMKLDIYYTAQSLERVDKIIREISNFAWYMRKFPFGWYRASCYTPETINKEKRICYASNWFRIDKKLASNYNTYEILDIVF